MPAMGAPGAEDEPPAGAGTRGPRRRRAPGGRFAARTRRRRGVRGAVRRRVRVQPGLRLFAQLGGRGPAVDHVGQVRFIEEAAGLQRLAQGLAQHARAGGGGRMRLDRGIGAAQRGGWHGGQLGLAGGGSGNLGRGRRRLSRWGGLGGLRRLARGRLGRRARGLAAGLPGGRAGGPQRRAALQRGRGLGILGQQGEYGARGRAQRGRGRGRGVAAGDQPAGRQGQRGGGLGVHDRILAFAAGAAALHPLARIARRAVGGAGSVQAAGLADRVRPRAGSQVRVGGGHRRAEHGVQPLHQDVAECGGAYAHSSGAWWP